MEIRIITDEITVKNNLIKIHNQVYELQADQINSRLLPEYLDCDVYEKKIVLKFPVQHWELNMAGILHGGIISTMIDHTMACTCVAFTGDWSPTTDLAVSFIKPAREGDILLAYGKIKDSDENRLYLECELRNAESNQLIATGSAIYFAKSH